MNIALQLGLEPFSFMQKTYVIGGKLGIEAQVAIAVANQRKVFKEPLEYAFEGDYDTKPISRKCTCTGILSANGKKVSMPLSWKEVEAEGWNKKGGSKWLTIPDQMFRYRTALWLIRTYAPETLLGLTTVEEIDDARVIDITPEKNVAADALMGRGDVSEPAKTVAEPTKKTQKPKAEKPVETEKPAEAKTEKPADADTEKPVEDEKPAETPKLNPVQLAVEAEMMQYNSDPFVFDDDFSIEQCRSVLKELRAKANVNEATFPLMVKSVTDGVTDDTLWTQDHWVTVRNTLLAIIKRGAEHKARAKK